MDLAYPPEVEALRTQVRSFLDRRIVPRIGEWHQEVSQGQYPVSFIEMLKTEARSEGLWNLFLPGLREDEPGTRLTNLQYAPLAEIMGRVAWASEVFNCNAPDTGNMELLHLAASPEQYQQWLAPGSEPVGHAYAGKGDTFPGELLAMAQRFPNARIVGAHWGGGLPFYAHMPEVREALANVWFDSAASPFL